MKGAFVSVFLFALWDNGLTLQCWRVSSPGQQPAFWARYPAERGSAGSGTPGPQSRAPGCPRTHFSRQVVITGLGTPACYLQQVCKRGTVSMTTLGHCPPFPRVQRSPPWLPRRVRSMCQHRRTRGTHRLLRSRTRARFPKCVKLFSVLFYMKTMSQKILNIVTMVNE